MMQAKKITSVLILSIAPGLVFATDPTICPSNLAKLEQTSYWQKPDSPKFSPDKYQFNQVEIEEQIRTHFITCEYAYEDDYIDVFQNPSNWSTSVHEPDGPNWDYNTCSNQDSSQCPWINH